MLYFQSLAHVAPGEGNMEKYLSLVSRFMPIIEKNGGKIIGVWQTVVGEWGEVLMVEAYKDMGQYEQARAKMANDPVWQELIPKVEAIRTVKVHLMRPAPFSPLQ